MAGSEPKNAIPVSIRDRGDWSRRNWVKLTHKMTRLGQNVGSFGLPCRGDLGHGALTNLFEEVVPFIINEDESGEVFYFDLPDGFHAEFREIDDLLGANVFLGQ